MKLNLFSFNPLESTRTAYTQAATYSNSSKKVDWIFRSRIQAFKALICSVTGIVVYPLGAVKHLLCGVVLLNKTELCKTGTSLKDWGKSMGNTPLSVVNFALGFFLGGYVFRRFGTPVTPPNGSNGSGPTGGSQPSGTNGPSNSTPVRQEHQEIPTLNFYLSVKGFSNNLKSSFTSAFTAFCQREYSSYVWNMDSNTQTAGVSIPVTTLTQKTADVNGFKIIIFSSRKSVSEGLKELVDKRDSYAYALFAKTGPGEDGSIVVSAPYEEISAVTFRILAEHIIKCHMLQPQRSPVLEPTTGTTTPIQTVSGDGSLHAAQRSQAQRSPVPEPFTSRAATPTQTTPRDGVLHVAQSSPVPENANMGKVLGYSMRLPLKVEADFKKWFEEKYPTHTLVQDAACCPVVGVEVKEILRAIRKPSSTMANQLEVRIFKKGEVTVPPEDIELVFTQPVLRVDLQTGGVDMTPIMGKDLPPEGVDLRTSTYQQIATFILGQHKIPSSGQNFGVVQAGSRRPNLSQSPIQILGDVARALLTPPPQQRSNRSSGASTPVQPIGTPSRSKSSPPNTGRKLS